MVPRVAGRQGVQNPSGQPGSDFRRLCGETHDCFDDRLRLNLGNSKGARIESRKSLPNPGIGLKLPLNYVNAVEGGFGVWSHLPKGVANSNRESRVAPQLAALSPQFWNRPSHHQLAADPSVLYAMGDTTKSPSNAGPHFYTGVLRSRVRPSAR